MRDTELMTKLRRYVGFWLLLLMTVSLSASEPVRVIAIGAHPDDCDIKASGIAAKYTALGHKVKFVSVTNGDAGHQSEGGGMLAARRRAEAQDSGRRLGIEYVVLDNHDGELVPSLEVRLQIIRLIREWDADIVIAPRPNDYHPDHRYTGILVQDASYMVTVPNIASDTPAIRKNPLFLYFSDRFERPQPFRPDIVVSIDDVIDQKYNALDAHVSQFYEWLPWHAGRLDDVPKDPAKRLQWLKQARSFAMPDSWRDAARARYGDAATAIQHAEAFEITEYGIQPDENTIRALMPFFPEP